MMGDDAFRFEKLKVYFKNTNIREETHSALPYNIEQKHYNQFTKFKVGKQI
jgi:hypothetical protein